MDHSYNGLRQGALASVVIATLVLQSGCSTDSATFIAPEGPLVTALTATSISGTVAGTASIVPTIRITNARDGQPIPNVAVTFYALGRHGNERPRRYQFVGRSECGTVGFRIASGNSLGRCLGIRNAKDQLQGDSKTGRPLDNSISRPSGSRTCRRISKAAPDKCRRWFS